MFRRNGVPYFFLSCGHWAHYHRPTDTPDRLNYKKMERITRQTCDLFAGLDAQPLKCNGGQERLCDTLVRQGEWKDDAEAGGRYC